MSGAFGGSTPMPDVQTFNYPGMGGAAGGALGGIGDLSQFSMGGLTMPQMQNITQGMVGSPLGAPGMTAAGQAGPQFSDLSMGTIPYAQQLQGAGAGLVPQAQKLMEMGFDPQGAFYNQTANNLMNQQGVINANAGVGQTPFGASVTGNTMGQFNLGWNREQLQRALAGAQGGSGLLSESARLGAGAQELGQAGAQGAVGGALLPYSTNAMLEGNKFDWLNKLISGGQNAAGVPQMQIADFMNYLQGGTGAMSAANQAQLAKAKLQSDQEQQQFKNIGSAFGGLGSMFGASGMFGSGAGGGAFGGGGGGKGMGGAEGLSSMATMV